MSTQTSAPRVSDRAGLVQPFAAMGIVAKVQEMSRNGRDTIAMCLGEPTQGAPGPVRRRAAEVVADGTNLGYSPIFGIPELRTAIAGHYRDWYGVEVPTERIAITTGSSGAFQTAFLTCFDAGDRVALARPGYGAYKNILAALNCEIVELDCGGDHGFQPTVELLEQAHAQAPLKGLMLASPANPTGTMISGEHLGELISWCAEHGVQVISDEIYHGISYIGTRGETALAHDDNAIVISSFSKYWAMTGWRLGWAILPESLASAAQNVTGKPLTVCPGSCPVCGRGSIHRRSPMTNARPRSNPSPALANTFSTPPLTWDSPIWPHPMGRSTCMPASMRSCSGRTLASTPRPIGVSLCLRPPELPWHQVMTSTPSTGLVRCGCRWLSVRTRPPRRSTGSSTS